MHDIDVPLIYFENNRSLFRDLHRLLGQSPRLKPLDHPFWDSLECYDLMVELCQRLSLKAPEGYYFGGHPMDPFSIGFWRKQ